MKPINSGVQTPVIDNKNTINKTEQKSLFQSISPEISEKILPVRIESVEYSDTTVLSPIEQRVIDTLFHSFSMESTNKPSETPQLQRNQWHYHSIMNDHREYFRSIPYKERSKEDYALVLLIKDGCQFLKDVDDAGLNEIKKAHNELVNNGVIKREESKERQFLTLIPDDEKTKLGCLTFCKNDISCMDLVPDRFKDEEFYLLLVNGENLQCVPSSERSVNICLTSLNNDFKSWQWIPENYKALCGFAYEIIEYNLFHEAELDISNSLRNELLLMTAIVEPNQFKKLSRSLSLDAALIDEILSKRNIGFLIPEIPIISTNNPVSSRVKNLHLLYLIQSCYRNQQHAFSVKGQPPVLNWINEREGDCRFFKLKKDLCFSFEASEVVGGRTCRIDDGNRSYHYKFQRIEEEEASLVRESLVNQYFNENYDRIGLESEVPTSEQLFKIPLIQLPESIRKQFKDEIKIVKEKNGEFVQGYCYSSASHDYCNYVHTANNPVEKQKAREGMRKAVRDLARFNKPDGQGCLALTSLIPGYHGGRGRRWFALSTLIDVPNSWMYSGRLASSGRFSDWCGSATECPDVGYSGLRDYGDFECAGDISSYDEQRFCRETERGYPDKVKQSVYFLNSIADNFIGMTLLYARSERYEAGYCYKNPDAIKAFSHFLEEMFEDYLSVYKGSSATLSGFLALDEESYRQLLDRTAIECLYWTSVQSGEIIPESKKNKVSDGERTGFMKDMADMNFNDSNVHLDSKIYPLPSNNVCSNLTTTFFGEGHTTSFIDVSKTDMSTENLSLGAANCALPLLSLQQLITVFCGHLIEES